MRCVPTPYHNNCIVQDETKVTALPKDLTSECLLVTAGIGNDILAEQSFETVLPHCRFVGNVLS
jgi:hypothetical protein